MRSLRYALLSPIFLTAFIGFGQQKRHTDAQNDDFAGPIKSVSTVTTHANVKWSQPSGPTMVLPVWCQDCAYDPDGMKTRSGQILDEKFVGDNIELVRDPNGHIANRRRINASTGELFDEETWGPFGKDGVVTERSGWGKDDHLDSRETYDPETDVQHFTTYDEPGNVKLTWTYTQGHVESYWAQSDGPQFGDTFIDFKDNGDSLRYYCQKDRQCERSVVHYDYLSPNKRNPTSAEWRDANGNLTLAAYCEYELDSFQNWTRRLVFVWSPDLPERSTKKTPAASSIGRNSLRDPQPQAASSHP